MFPSKIKLYVWLVSKFNIIKDNKWYSIILIMLITLIVNILSDIFVFKIFITNAISRKKTTFNNNVDVYVIPVDESIKYDASSLVMSLRLNGFKVDMDYVNRNMKSNFKQADRINAKYIIIIGEDEVKTNTLTIKNTQF